MTPSSRKPVLVAILSLLMLSLAVGSASAQSMVCSQVANVSWVTDWDALTVEEVVVEVPGCSDGERVGIQLITDDGDLPGAGPRGSLVDAERARFDVTDLNVGVKPLTGLRVFLVFDGEEVEVLTLSIEQRFFNAAGREQVGLRQATDLLPAPGATYFVPEAEPGYGDVGCDAVATSLGESVIGQGPGEFVATFSGTHVVCYQQVPGTPGGPGPDGPEADLPEVLDRDLERPAGGVDAPTDDGTEVLGVWIDVETGTGLLSRTGFEAVTGALSGLLLVVLGAGIIRRCRTIEH